MMTLWAYPWIFLTGSALTLLLIGLLWLSGKRQQHRLSQFAASHMLSQLTRNISRKKILSKRILSIASFYLLILALARPQFGYTLQENKSKGLDILFLVDTSQSMLAQDMRPDRLTRAKLAITDLLPLLQGDRIGLVAFAGEAFLQCPLTLDYNAFQQALDALDTGIIQRGGTDIASALIEAQSTFEKNNSDKVIILITDGEDLEASGVKTAQSLAQQNILVFPVGVGSTVGELIPVLTATGQLDYLRDNAGNLVKTQLDESTLQQIAQTTGSFYLNLNQNNQALVQIYQQGLDRLERAERKSQYKKVPHEYYHYPLALAGLLIIIEMLITSRKRARFSQTTVATKT